MAQRRRLLEMMKAGESWKNITSSGSRSVVYQALNIYFEEAEEKYEKLRSSIEQLEGELAERRGELQNIEARVTAGEHFIGELEERRRLLEEELKKLEDSFEEKQGRWDELNSKLEKLDQRGVTEEARALAFFGLGIGISATARTLMMARYFGRKNFGTITGIQSTIGLPSTLIIPIYAGWVYDTTGSYIGGFILLLSLDIVGVFLYLISNPPKQPSE